MIRLVRFLSAKKQRTFPWLHALPLAMLTMAGCGGSANSTSSPPPPTLVATPTFSPAGGTFNGSQSVTISDTTAGATIYYTTDGTTPTISSTKYTTAIAVASTTTIDAIGTASGDTNSVVATATYTITAPVVATPTFSPAAGNFATAQSVSISDATAGSAIYYTVDGTTPTTSSAPYSTPINVTATTTLEAIATAPGGTTSAVASGAYTIGPLPPTVSVVLTTHDRQNLLASQTAVTFGNSPAISNQVQVDEAQQYQTIDGFGAAFTDSASYLLEQVAQPSELSSTLSDLFTRNGAGIGLSFMRNPMGSTDLARSVYTFDDVASSQTDAGLSGFSISHDQSYILPLIQQAKALNPQMKLMANPWSPPAWMKTPASVEGGDLNSSYYTSFANYFVKYLQDYSAAGAPIDYISLQNEPLNNTTAYPSMYMDAPTELTVMRDYILPALTAANLTTKIFVYDHNWDTPSYPTTILSDPTIMASPLVAGTAWHGYGGPPGRAAGSAERIPHQGNVGDGTLRRNLADRPVHHRLRRDHARAAQRRQVVREVEPGARSEHGAKPQRDIWSRPGRVRDLHSDRHGV